MLKYRLLKPYGIPWRQLEASCLSLSLVARQRDRSPYNWKNEGVGYEIGKELARRLGIPYEPIIYKTPKLLVDDIESGKLGRSLHCAVFKSRGNHDIQWKPTFSLEQGSLVPADSPIKTMNEVNRPGIRVGVPSGGSIISRVAGILSDEKLVEIGMPQAADLISSGAVDVFPRIKETFFQISDQLPGSRVLDGYFTVDEFALGIPIGRKIEMSLLNEFIEEIKEQGLIEGASKRAGVRGVVDQ